MSCDSLECLALLIKKIITATNTTARIEMIGPIIFQLREFDAGVGFTEVVEEVEGMVTTSGELNPMPTEVKYGSVLKTLTPT